MKQYKTELVNISLVKENQDNPRFISEDKFEQLKKSISEFPEMLKLRPIIVDDNMTVLGGNMRLKACRDLGITEVPIIKASNLTADEQRRFIIVDNVGFGQWDWDILANEWDSQELGDWGLDVWQPEDQEDVIEAKEDDYTEPDNLQVDVVLGDLIEIGEHRLLCGDSTDVEQVDKLMAGEKADMAHNDPPYGMKKEKDGVLNDNLNFKKLLEFNRDWISIQFSVLKDNGSWYCWGIDEPLMDIYSDIIKPYIETQKATFRNLITWDKGTGQGQMSDGFRMYPVADEKCLFVMCGVQGFNNNADNYFHGWDSIVKYLNTEKDKANFTIKDCKKIAGHSVKSGCHWFDKSQWMMPTKETYNSWAQHCQQNNIDAFKKEYDELKKEYDELKKEYYSTRAFFDNTHDNQNNVWHFQRCKERSGGHATPKPIPLCERAIKSSCPINGLAVDFFLGSGSTMVAAHQLNRKCYGMELDPKYCQVIIDRMHKLDSSLPIKINGKEYKPNTNV